MLHIGIVACSTEGAALCYRTISLEGSRMLGRQDHPENIATLVLAGAIHEAHRPR